MIRSQGLEPLLWSKWVCDWRRGATPSTIAAAATAGLAAGDVILLHDLRQLRRGRELGATAAAVPLIVESVRSAGLAFASARRGRRTADLEDRNRRAAPGLQPGPLQYESGRQLAICRWVLPKRSG